MADYAKDSEKQAALRRQIEKHPIWQYPPEERLQHNREWQSLYLLVFEFKEFLQKLENRLNNAEYDTGLLKQDEDAMLDARYTRRSKLRNKLDTLTFTEAMRKAVARYDASMEGSPYVLEVTDLTLKDDGTPDALSACTDCAVYIEFNEDGLPSFFAVAQEDVGYQITYTRTDDGRFVMDSAQCVYGYIYNHSAEPTNDFFTPTGEILYQ